MSMQTGLEIAVLPIEVANQIAAGEVVERPAAVVKELLENAIDAGADRLDIAVTAAGRKLISVSDNGRGMRREDAILSVERHATSKIRAVQDIESIRTLGFRGEALAAISSVSRFRLTTCRRGENVGTEVVVQGGHVQEARDCGVPEGTQVEVRDLFYNVPARRKFLRSDQTEVGHIRDVFINQALATPGYAMRLRVDGKDIYRLADADKLVDRLRDLFGTALVAQLAPVSWQGQEVQIVGYVSMPLAHRTDRNEQYVFVNGRCVSPALLRYAIGEGYQGALPKGRYPSVFLFLEMAPEQIDVNVHPTKREIRFRRPMQVRDAVIAAIQSALQKPGFGGERHQTEAVAPAPPSVAVTVPEARLPVSQGPIATLPIRDLPKLHAFQYPSRRSHVPDLPLGGRPVDEVFAAPSSLHRDQDPSGFEGRGDPSLPGSHALAADTAPWSSCRVLGQIGGIYVALETEVGLVLMDPRAAHERVLFERIRAVVAKRTVASQPLLLPETMTLTPRDGDRLRDSLASFHAMGFGISAFDSNTFMIDAIPAIFEGLSGAALVETVLGEVNSRSPGKGLQESQLLEAACRAAVGLRQQLSLAEIEQIVVDLARCEMPYTSPRGRPTVILMSLRELHRKFGRDVPGA